MSFYITNEIFNTLFLYYTLKYLFLFILSILDFFNTINDGQFCKQIRNFSFPYNNDYFSYVLNDQSGLHFGTEGVLFWISYIAKKCYLQCYVLQRWYYFDYHTLLTSGRFYLIWYTTKKVIINSWYGTLNKILYHQFWYIYVTS
jgi:hypothetical protein